MIAYGAEKGQGRSKLDAGDELPHGDGYATKEADIQIGGFLYVRAAQEASKTGKPLSKMTTEEKQKLALKIAKQHVEEYGAANHESYEKWMKRVQGYAHHNHLNLPSKGDRESSYNYARRIHKWTQEQRENWPELRKAVGTHLVFSPEPKYWEKLRAAGLDERQFLRNLLSKTMKDFADWRRDVYGPDHSIGWVAGTHVEADGADKHPHIHVVVLKRDESGKEVDWSVSSLKGCKGRNDPDPIKSIKDFFAKHAEKEYAKATNQTRTQTKNREKVFGRDSAHTQEKASAASAQADIPPSDKEAEKNGASHEDLKWDFARSKEQSGPGKDFKPPLSSRNRQAKVGLHLCAVTSALRPLLPPEAWQINREIGAIVRIISHFRQTTQTQNPQMPNISLASLRASISAFHARVQGPQLAPGA
ncbi:MAG: hypothetical protein PHV34_19180 [Verrucomicrobiae bacterium]|nr:hypothetical protein [Verrucomicrobiae bacterium]